MKLTYKLAVLTVLLGSLVACGDKPEQATVKDAPTVKEQAEKMAEETTKKSVVVESKGGIAVINAVARPTLPGQKMSSAFFNLANASDKEVDVVSLKSNVAKSTEIHTMEMIDSKMVMRPLDKVAVPAGGEFVMAKGANHVMLIDLNKPLESGDSVDFEVVLSNGETLNFTAKVEPMPEMPSE